MLISNWNICHYGWCYVYTSMLSPSFNSSNKYLSKHLNSLEVLVLFCPQYTKFGVLYHLARMNLWTLTANYFVELTEYNREWIKKSFFFRGGCLRVGDISKIAWKILLHKKILMIWSKTTILSLVFIYYIICLRNKKLSLWLWKHSYFCVKRLVLMDIQLIKEFKPNLNCLIKTVLGKTLWFI